MRTQVTLLLIVMISSGASSLQCYTPYTVYNTTTGKYDPVYTECTYKCAQTTTSVDIHLISGISGLTFTAVDYDFSCGSPQQCVNSSINIGVVKIHNNTQCCSTSLCNNETLPEMPQQSLNKGTCYTCNENDCSQTLKCEGIEDRCITATVTQGKNIMNMKGCTSNSVCNKTLLGVHGFIITDMECCQGNLCNGVKNFTPSILLMLSLYLLPLLLECQDKMVI